MRKVVAKKVKTPSVGEVIVKGRTCIHWVYDSLNERRTVCGKEISTEEIVEGKLTFGRQNGYLCPDHEYEVFYMRRRHVNATDQSRTDELPRQVQAE